MTYDPNERRDTPLALTLKQRIRREGPIPVAEYMRACLHDSEHGYYRRQPAIGAAADFVTAPEISQVFGELIGLWCAVAWQQMGSPSRLQLVELGPGRGTMMCDALRAARVVPGFLQAIDVHLIESNVDLRAVQREALSQFGVAAQWHDELFALSKLEAVPEGAAIVLANEFLDTLPVEQSVLEGGKWLRRNVGLDTGGRLVFGSSDDVEPWPADVLPATPPAERDVFEICSAHATIGSGVLGMRASRGPMAALFIDYGHMRTAYGDTLQAVWQQRPVSPLYAPGETDLTAQVDFEHFARPVAGVDADEYRLAIDGPVTQAEFLGSIGIVERASRLMAANPAKAAAIEAGVARLIAPQAMGSRFKAIGVRSAGLPPLPGFPVKG